MPPPATLLGEMLLASNLIGFLIHAAIVVSLLMVAVLAAGERRIAHEVEAARHVAGTRTDLRGRLLVKLKGRDEQLVVSHNYADLFRQM